MKTVAAEEATLPDLDHVDADAEDQDTSAEAERIQKIRDISGLRPNHRNIVHRVCPTEEKVLPHHYTTYYNKRMFGRYGYASGVNPGLCWPTQEQLAEIKEYERVAYPYSIMEVAKRELEKEEAEKERILSRDAEVADKYQKMLKLKEEFLKRKVKEKEEAEAAKAFKNRLIEEVRLHFNYTINERDERFRLEVKERAKQLREKEKLEKKTLKKEKQAVDKAAKFEIQKKQLLAEEERKAAVKST